MRHANASSLEEAGGAASWSRWSHVSLDSCCTYVARGLNRASSCGSTASPSAERGGRLPFRSTQALPCGSFRAGVRVVRRARHRRPRGPDDRRRRPEHAAAARAAERVTRIDPAHRRRGRWGAKLGGLSSGSEIQIVGLTAGAKSPAKNDSVSFGPCTPYPARTTFSSRPHGRDVCRRRRGGSREASRSPKGRAQSWHSERHGALSVKMVMPNG
jgi:hypothetical protein